MHFSIFLLALAFSVLPAFGRGKPRVYDVVIENATVRLVVGSNGMAKSLLYKPTRSECLASGVSVPIMSVTQERPFHNEIKLAHPNKRTTFQADTVYREGNRLWVGFELVPYKAVIELLETPRYIGFRVVQFVVDPDAYPAYMKFSPPPVAEIAFLQLPVKDREAFGEWLNVSFDKKLAVNVLATDPYARIEAEKREQFRIMKAEAEKGVRLEDVGAALIVCPTGQLLDCVAQVEADFGLPKGVESRRGAMINTSYYWSGDVTPANLAQHLRYAKQGGFRAMLLYYSCFTVGGGYDLLGNYDWRTSAYPGGKADLRKLLDTLKQEGITPGFHFLHSHIGINSRYVTPKADNRLHLKQYFTLAQPLSPSDTVLFVEENPAGTTLADGCRVLQVGSEMIGYSGYTTVPPFAFTGCSRGHYNTERTSQSKGLIAGILDVSEFGATSIYLDQRSDLQNEIARKLADFYDAGFAFVYYDGSEGVNPPFAHHVANAQYRVYQQLQPAPLFAEGAAKSHFSWHILSGGNAFDVFPPEFVKEGVRKFPAEEAPRMQNDFTRINFGWLGYQVPSKASVGTQPDMLEFVTSVAAGWDCPISVQSNLQAFKNHPRTPDNLEVLRRWEEVRATGWLTPRQKVQLQDVSVEHHLLLDAQQQFALVACWPIEGVAAGSREVRAFLFQYQKDWYVTYWHISGQKKLALPLEKGEVEVFREWGSPLQNTIAREAHRVVVPVGNRLYLKAEGLSKKRLTEAFQKAQLLD